MAELVDDHVRASVGDRLLVGVRSKWNLARGAVSLRRLTKRLLAAGARPSRYPSKLVHAVPGPPSRADAERSALLDHLRAQIDQIIAGDPRVAASSIPIDDTRVAIRRLRRRCVFAKDLDQTEIDPEWTTQSKWFAAMLVKGAMARSSSAASRVRSTTLPDELVLGLSGQDRTDCN